MKTDFDRIKASNPNFKDTRNVWGSIKCQRTMSLTLDAWDQLGTISNQFNSSRSEILEILIRQAIKVETDMDQWRLILTEQTEEVDTPI